MEIDEKYKKKEKLEKIEKKIEPLIKTQESWVEIYRLLKCVDEQCLYEYEYPSFTAWLKSFSERYKITPSLLWLQKKAGKFYENYCKYYRLLSIPVLPLEKIKIVPYVLTMIEKITAGNMQEAKILIDKAKTGNISRNELETLWNLEKQEREKNGLPTKRINCYDEEEFEKISYQNFNAQTTTLSDIGAVLCNPNWIVPETKVRKKYRLFTEFTKEKLFKDAFILAENYLKPKNIQKNIQPSYRFNLHLIYVKLDESEFDGEPVFPGYYDYADYYWVAVPYELLGKGQEYIRAHQNIGLLCYTKSSNNINIIKIAERNNNHGSLRSETVDILASYML